MPINLTENILTHIFSPPENGPPVGKAKMTDLREAKVGHGINF